MNVQRVSSRKRSTVSRMHADEKPEPDLDHSRGPEPSQEQVQEEPIRLLEEAVPVVVAKPRLRVVRERDVVEERTQLFEQRELRVEPEVDARNVERIALEDLGPARLDIEEVGIAE